MHSKDDCDAKFTMWARHPEFPAMPKMEALPGFKSIKFSSYREMNEWKKQMLLAIAEIGWCAMEEVIEMFNKAGVHYLLIGGQAMIRDGIKSIAKQGVCPESDWPYVLAKYRTKPAAKR